MDERARDARNETWGWADTEDAVANGFPGDWFLADFDGPCSRGCVGIFRGERVRQDGTGELECESCVLADQGRAADLRPAPEWATR